MQKKGRMTSLRGMSSLLFDRLDFYFRIRRSISTSLIFNGFNKIVCANKQYGCFVSTNSG